MQEFLKLEHGGGGSLTRELLEEIIIPSYTLNHLERGIGLTEMDDGATIPLGDNNIVVTTDATTVKPLFFPGGDLGRLAICGAVARAGQPGPAISETFSGRRCLSPVWVMVHSWVSQT